MHNKYYFGLDLGQSQDYSALSIIERTNERKPDVKYIKGYEPVPYDPAKAIYHLGYLERFALGTSYTTVVEKVSALMNREPFKDRSSLVIDTTGVGDAIFDMFVTTSLKPIGIFFTGGNVVGRSKKFYTVPKRDLVFALLALFETERLKIAAGLQHSKTLASELLNFRIKIGAKTGHDSYEHWREKDHDDLLFATAVVAWYAVKKGRPIARALGAKPYGFQ